MNYSLDTSAVVALLRGRPASARRRLAEAVASDATVAISSIVLFELWYGVARSDARRVNAERLRVFLAGNIVVMSFDDEDAATAGHVRHVLADVGTPIGPYDVMIAGQALRRGLTLVTAHVSEFGRVRGLAIEDWTG